MINDLVCYKTLPIWNNDTLPQSFRDMHNTQIGTWAKLTILSGKLEFALLDEQGAVTEMLYFSCEHQPPFIEPQQWHKIATTSADLECQLAFYCLPEDFVNKKYSLTKTHSEVIEAVKTVPVGDVLDLGCGSGRNSLFLNLLGFKVTAYDRAEASIASLNDIINQDNLTDISADVYDINRAAINQDYDFIVSTVVLMFLDPNQIPTIIENMQQHTRLGGYNLIVSAMSTDDYPCTVGFPFTFKQGELKGYYQDWDIIKYNENIGQLHKTDSNGDRISLQFATLLARKKG